MNSFQQSVHTVSIGISDWFGRPTSGGSTKLAWISSLQGLEVQSGPIYCSYVNFCYGCKMDPVKYGHTNKGTLEQLMVGTVLTCFDLLSK